MTRQEAAEKFFNLLHDERFSWTPNTVEALQMAIDALDEDKNVPSKDGDLIYRQDAIHVVSGLDSSFVKYIEELPPAQPEQKWIPFKSRPLTEEEKEDHPEWDFILDGKLPEDGQRILVNVKYRGHEAVQYDEYYDDGGCYLDSGYEIGTEVTAWMPLPKPYGGEPGC